MLVFWEMVNVHMNLLICDLYNKTANNLDTTMSKELFMSNEFNGRKNLNVHLGLIGNTILTISITH